MIIVFKVIADYPDSIHTVGSTIHLDSAVETDAETITDLEKYPAIFQRVEEEEQ